ncbi:MAG: hypothetical protein GXO57_09155 [Thermodesulfobacteria bacterium]|nr:hypothetical protein [Thermodesulfobacteriota bacterium]
MFDFLRRSATSPVAKVFLAIIIIVFVFWGVGVFTVGNREIIAKVNGLPITLKDFQEYYNFEVFKLKQTYGELNSEQLKALNIKQKVLNDLIRMKVLEKEADDLGIKVSPEEVNYAIARIPIFQENGKFNYQKYLAILQDIGVSSEFFKYLIRSDLLFQKIRTLVTAPIIVSKDEAEDYVRFNNQTLTFIKGWIPLKACEAEVKVTEKALKSYYLAHRDVYTEPEKVKLAYLLLPYKAKVKVTDDEVEKYYLEHINDFKRPLEVKLKAILITGGKDAQKKAEEVRSKLKSLKDFEKFKNYNLRELGWIPENALMPSIRPLIKRAKKGDIIGPIPVRSGYVIFGVEDIKPEKVFSLSEVKEQIRAYLKEKKIRQKVKAKADSIYAEVVELNGLKEWAKKHKISLQTTKFLDQSGLLKLFHDLKLVKQILKASIGEYFPPVPTEKGIYIFEVSAKKPPKLLKFEQVKSKVRKDFLKDEGKKICEKKADEFFLLVKKESVKKALKEVGFKSELIKVLRYQVPRKFPFEVGQVLSSLGKPGVVEKPFWEMDNLEVFYLKDILPYKGKVSKEEIELMIPALLRQKRAGWFNKWYQNLIMSSEVKIYPLFKKL